MSDVHLTYVNDVYMKVDCEPHILMELSDQLSFFKKNYKFDPKYRNRMWDGKIRLVNRMTRLVYAGLAHRIKKFCDARNYTMTWDDQFYYANVSEEEVRQHITNLNLPEGIQDRDYQFDSIVKCLRSNRRTLVSPTSSGKSFMIYVIAEWYKKKTLIIVPRTGLVTQFRDDIYDYGFKGKIHTSTDGLLKDNNIDADYVITTWQSLENGKSKMPKSWFDQFDVVFGDEAHGLKATSLIKIMTAMENTPYRFGTTGTLDPDPLDQATIEGLLGPKFQTITTREMIDQGYAPDITIKCIVLRYPEHVRKEFHSKMRAIRKSNPDKKRIYHEEIAFLESYEPRTRYIKNLSLSLTGNKLIFFRHKEHGKSIFNAFNGKENVFFIDGGVKVDVRDEFRKILETLDDANLVASLGTTSTGISIKKLHHMIIGAPTKAMITLLQAIGRMLRQHESKEEITVFDIVDDLSQGTQKNYALLHFEERAKIYDNEKFRYKIYNVGIK